MSSDTSEYERVVLVKPEVFVYRIPVRTTNRAYRYSVISNLRIRNFFMLKINYF